MPLFRRNKIEAAPVIVPEADEAVEETAEEKENLKKFQITLFFEGGGAPFPVGMKEESPVWRKALAETMLEQLNEEMAGECRVVSYDITNQGIKFYCQGEFTKKNKAVLFAKIAGFEVREKNKHKVFFDAEKGIEVLLDIEKERKAA